MGARSEDYTRIGRGPTRYVPPAPQAQKRGSPSLALDAALVHTS